MNRASLLPRLSLRPWLAVALGLATLAAASSTRAQISLDLPPSLLESASGERTAERLTLPFPESGVVRLLLGMDVTNGFRPPEGPARVRVASLQNVLLVAPAEWTHPVQWMKDGGPIAGATDRTYSIPVATAAAAGLYSLAPTAPAPHIATAIRLDVAPAETLGNVSARLRLAPGESVQVLGFVIRGSESKELLVRAIGPSLRVFGVAATVRRPWLRIFNAAGEELNAVRPAVVLPPSYWASVFRRAGAFPLSDADLYSEACDVISLPPGAYTVHLSDLTKGGGELLAEVYELDPDVTVL